MQDAAAMHPAERKLRAPGLGMLAAELRGVLELNASFLMSPALMRAPRGDGHAVLTLPGFLASGLSMMPMRRYLDRLGYRSHDWSFGRNFGGVYSMRDRLRRRLADLHRASGRRVSLVGWSLGGIYARDLALHMPEAVRYVITIASPFAGDVTATNATRLYELLSRERVMAAPPDDIDALSGDLPVPTSALYTRGDGVVNWRTCLARPAPQAENIEILLASHLGIGVNPAALWAIADRLSQAEGAFAPFDRGGPFAFAYPPPATTSS
jgi:pimeloyl-ACP methyl ester carboxylesterase